MHLACCSLIYRLRWKTITLSLHDFHLFISFSWIKEFYHVDIKGADVAFEEADSTGDNLYGPEFIYEPQFSINRLLEEVV